MSATTLKRHREKIWSAERPRKQLQRLGSRRKSKKTIKVIWWTILAAAIGKQVTSCKLLSSSRRPRSTGQQNETAMATITRHQLATNLTNHLCEEAIIKRSSRWPRRSPREVDRDATPSSTTKAPPPPHLQHPTTKQIRLARWSMAWSKTTSSKSSRLTIENQHRRPVTRSKMKQSPAWSYRKAAQSKSQAKARLVSYHE